MESADGNSRCLRRCLLQGSGRNYEAPADLGPAESPGLCARLPPAAGTLTFGGGFLLGIFVALGAVFVGGGRLPSAAQSGAAASPSSLSARASRLSFGRTRAEETLGELSAAEVRATAEWFV